MSVAKTILNQVKTLDPRAVWAWVAKNFVSGEDYLMFKTSGMVKWKGWVKINLDYGTDTYNVEFFRIRKAEKKVDCELSYVYADMLIDVIDSQVG